MGIFWENFAKVIRLFKMYQQSLSLYDTPYVCSAFNFNNFTFTYSFIFLHNASVLEHDKNTKLSSS